MDRLIAGILSVALGGWRRIKRLGPIQRYLYSLRNAGEFGEVLSHEIMLADSARVNAYHAAIDRYVTAEDTVLDLGTGTGILAMMAARKARRVHAIDQTRIVELAEHFARRNGIDNIVFERVHSREIDLPEEVDVIVQEQIGDFLIDEDMIANVCSLRDRVLAPGGRILPARFEVYLEPLSLREGEGIPLLWEQRIHGIDFGSAREWLNAHPDLAVMRARYLSPDAASHFLAEPQPAFTLDLETLPPDHTPGTIRLTRAISRDGIMDGLCMYFRICFDDTIWIRNGPFDRRHDHWPCVMFPTGRTPLRSGDTLEIEWTIDTPTRVTDWKLSWRVLAADREAGRTAHSVLEEPARANESALEFPA